MAGELSGLSFGSYDGLFNELKIKYTVKTSPNPQQNGNEHEFKFFDREKGGIIGNGFRENIVFNSMNHEPCFANAVIFKDGLQFGTCARTKEGLNVFDYILGKDEYAIDLNGNGKVDNNEIFKGGIDRFAYKKAKESGDLNNYKKFQEQYSWLK